MTLAAHITRCDGGKHLQHHAGSHPKASIHAGSGVIDGDLVAGPTPASMALSNDQTRCAGGKHSACPAQVSCARYQQHQATPRNTRVVLQYCVTTERKIESKA